MKSQLIAAALLALTLFLFPDMCLSQDALPSKPEPIWGEWFAMSSISSGKVAKNNQDVLFEKDRMIWKRRDNKGNGETWEYTIDPTKEPKQITMVRTSGLPDIETGKPQRINAIYEHTEKELRIAFLPGRNGSSLEERPIGMTSTNENKAIVLVLTRNTVQDAESR